VAKDFSRSRAFTYVVHCKSGNNILEMVLDTDVVNNRSLTGGDRAYQIAATLSVFEDHSVVVSRFKCDILYL